MLAIIVMVGMISILILVMWVMWVTRVTRMTRVIMMMHDPAEKKPRVWEDVHNPLDSNQGLFWLLALQSGAHRRGAFRYPIQPIQIERDKKQIQTD